MLFASLAVSDLDAAAAFRSLVERGPAAIADLSADRRVLLQSEISSAFRAAFLTISAFAAIGIALAWSIPARRL